MKLRQFTEKVSHLSPKLTGNRAEKETCIFLVNSGYKVITRNWKRKDCEIDIVAKKHNQMLFVEVKYRQGGMDGAVASLTRAKIRQMQYSAIRYCQVNKYDGEYQVGFAAVSGAKFNNLQMYYQLDALY